MFNIFFNMTLLFNVGPVVVVLLKFREILLSSAIVLWWPIVNWAKKTKCVFKDFACVLRISANYSDKNWSLDKFGKVW